MIDIDINPAVDRAGWRIAHNIAATNARLTRIATMYATAETSIPQVLAWTAEFQASTATCPWMYLVGPVGTGKTHAALAALRIAVQTPRIVRWHFASVAQMLDDFRPGGPDDADDRYLRSDLLILDDVTIFGSTTAWPIEQIYRVLDDRRRNFRPTILTTNTPPAELKGALNEQIVSRITQSCTVVAITGEDRRRAPREPR